MAGQRGDVMVMSSAAGLPLSHLAMRISANRFLFLLETSHPQNDFGYRFPESVHKDHHLQ